MWAVRHEWRGFRIYIHFQHLWNESQNIRKKKYEVSALLAEKLSSSPNSHSKLKVYAYYNFNRQHFNGIFDFLPHRNHIFVPSTVFQIHRTQKCVCWFFLFVSTLKSCYYFWCYCYFGVHSFVSILCWIHNYVMGPFLFKEPRVQALSHTWNDCVIETIEWRTLSIQMRTENAYGRNSKCRSRHHFESKQFPQTQTDGHTIPTECRKIREREKEQKLKLNESEMWTERNFFMVMILIILFFVQLEYREKHFILILG